MANFDKKDIDIQMANPVFFKGCEDIPAKNMCEIKKTLTHVFGGNVFGGFYRI